MRRSEIASGPAWRLGRLGLISAAFIFAASMVSSGGALTPGIGNPDARAQADEALVSAFDGPDRVLVTQGRTNDLVGRPASSIDLRSFSGGALALGEAGRVVVMTFVSADCEDCAPELSKLAALSVVHFDRIYVAAIAPDGQAEAVEAMMEDAGGAGLILGGEDAGDVIAERFGVTGYPTTAVIGPDGTVEAVWTGPVPLSVYYGFLEAAYGIKNAN